MAIVDRDHPDPRSLDTIVSGLLLSVARRHESQLGSTFDQLETAMVRLVDDLEALRSGGGPGRTPDLREADLRTVAEAINSMPTFENRLRAMVDDNAGQLNDTLRGIANSTSPAPTALTPPASAVNPPATSATPPTSGTTPVVAAVVHPPLQQSMRLGNESLTWAREIYAAFRRRRTLEHPSVDPVPIPDHVAPALNDQMVALNDAAASFDALMNGQPTRAQAAQAAESLRRTAADTYEMLRGTGASERFTSTRSGDRQPPLTGAVPTPGTPAAAALTDAVAAQTRTIAAGATAPADQLMTAMTFSDLHASATGTLSEPLARAGLENHTLGSAEIRAHPTSPPWLRNRLADLVQGWQRAHLIGPGFGGELFVGLMLAPWGVNQLAQNRGIERMLRDIADAARGGSGFAITPTVTATGRRLSIPLAGGGFEYVDVLGSVVYELARGTNQPPYRIAIAVNPDGSWAVTHDLPAGTWPAATPLSGTR